jgi:hypothetical protein
MTHTALATALLAVMLAGGARAQAPAAPPGHSMADMADLQTLADLRRAGADLSRPQTPVYFLLFGDEAGARAARRAAEAEGFGTLKLMRVRDSAHWALILTRIMPLSLDNVTSASRSLQAIAVRYDGRYDGWQADPRR